MKERPIPFNSDMVRAILDGMKAQTRRVVKPQPPHGDNPAFYPTEMQDHGKPHWLYLANDPPDIIEHYTCPYGLPGDRLWVREAWRTGDGLDPVSARVMADRCLAANYPRPWAPLRYEADHATDNADTLADFGGSWGRYRHARFMPRWASRITLEITDVRVERLLDISEEDAECEGVEPSAPPEAVEATGREHRTAFRMLWDSIHSNKPGRSWRDNPWVWVVEFDRVEGGAA